MAGNVPTGDHASVAQLAEQLICNQPVVGSNPSAGSGMQSTGNLLESVCRLGMSIRSTLTAMAESESETGLTTGFFGGLPEWLKGADCKSASYAYTGSNPVAPTEKNM